MRWSNEPNSLAPTSERQAYGRGTQREHPRRSSGLGAPRLDPLTSSTRRAYYLPVGFPALTTIDLFAGCGGLSLGLKRAGWDIICAVERSPMAAETYFANFVASGEEIGAEYADHLSKTTYDQVRAGLLVGDVREFGDCIYTVREMLDGQELALLSGGPPCQGFSLAGRRSPNDPRNDLVWSFLKVAEELGPLAVLLENVGAIQSPFKRENRAGVLSALEDALQETAPRYGGYAVVRLSLRADHYGVPQRRRRVFLVGVRKDVAASIGMCDRDRWDSERASSELPASPVAPRVRREQAPTAREALWDLLGEHYASIKEAPSPLAREFAIRARGGSGSHGTVPASPNGVEPPNHRFRSHNDATRTRFRLIRLFRESGVPRHLFELAANGQAGVEPQLKPLERQLPIEFPIARVETLGQLADLVLSLPSLKHSQRALDGNAPSPTVTTLPDDLCHYAADRTLTVREMARLQSFPDSFVFRGKETTGGHKRRVEVPQYSQVGNAVPPILANALGIQLKELLLPRLSAAPRLEPESDKRPSDIHCI